MISRKCDVSADVFTMVLTMKKRSPIRSKTYRARKNRASELSVELKPGSKGDRRGESAVRPPLEIITPTPPAGFENPAPCLAATLHPVRLDYFGSCGSRDITLPGRSIAESQATVVSANVKESQAAPDKRQNTRRRKRISELGSSHEKAFN